MRVLFICKCVLYGLVRDGTGEQGMMCVSVCVQRSLHTCASTHPTCRGGWRPSGRGTACFLGCVFALYISQFIINNKEKSAPTPHDQTPTQPLSKSTYVHVRVRLHAELLVPPDQLALQVPAVRRALGLLRRHAQDGDLLPVRAVLEGGGVALLLIFFGFL